MERSDWILKWEYVWRYKPTINEFRIAKFFYLWNDKKRRNAHKPEEVLYRKILTVEVPFKIVDVEVEHYDSGEWCVSERSSFSIKQVKQYDKDFLQNIFDKIVKSLTT